MRPKDVEKRQQSGEAGGDGGNARELRGCELIVSGSYADQAAGEHLLQKRGGHAQDPDSGGDVQHQDAP
jgi:hypothetical protein